MEAHLIRSFLRMEWCEMPQHLINSVMAATSNPRTLSIRSNMCSQPLNFLKCQWFPWCSPNLKPPTTNKLLLQPPLVSNNLSYLITWINSNSNSFPRCHKMALKITLSLVLPNSNWSCNSSSLHHSSPVIQVGNSWIILHSWAIISMLSQVVSWTTFLLRVVQPATVC